ncbi:MAG: SIMPL domain-containing protein [Gemmatimonadetes bacterium]|nr:SIMPL domain-containing protein [Gemmatimonadota bacterium]
MPARDLQPLLSAIVLGLALVIAAALGANAITRVKAAQQTVTVTGSAKRQITSDMIIWRGFVSHQSSDLTAAYADLKVSMGKLRAYLGEQQIPTEQIVETSIQTMALHPVNEQGMEMSQILGYRLTQGVEIRSGDVDKITRVSREATDLINQGVALESNPPEYLYTKLGDLKVQILADAAKDAKVRAEQIARATGSEIGQVRSARMGVLQITPAFSNEVSDYGINDVSSLQKDITAVTTVEFEIR